MRKQTLLTCGLGLALGLLSCAAPIEGTPSDAQRRIERPGTLRLAQYDVEPSPWGTGGPVHASLEAPPPAEPAEPIRSSTPTDAHASEDVSLALVHPEAYADLPLVAPPEPTAAASEASPPGEATEARPPSSADVKSPQRGPSSVTATETSAADAPATPPRRTKRSRKRVREVLLRSEVLETLANHAFEGLAEVEGSPRRKRANARGFARRGDRAEQSVAVGRVKTQERETPNPELHRRGQKVRVEGPERRSDIKPMASDVVRRVLRQSESRIHLCYLEALETEPGLSGRIVAALDVSPRGKVANTRIAESTVAHDAVERCVQRVIRTLVFPRDANDETTTVTYHWRFQPPAP